MIFNRKHCNIYEEYHGVHPASWGQLGSYLMEKYRIWLRKSTLIDLTERNANQIIPLYCCAFVNQALELDKPQEQSQHFSITLCSKNGRNVYSIAYLIIFLFVSRVCLEYA